ncbi:hypothetical protein LY28_03511 [Ruminiclostridium sufflavum DSM 19573]|uniref:Uncharacterized protein n=1 Tax=Ruminiclostridium sufflavum DSM 19573 TaxID=1121337 RepID=A0A318XIE7_9FIRM|nr:hypothetical protein [Ruminiclostridium sufflavum]PYG84890.1 hypothetical protein LY28_03511 [Ruminiclostridium sufflavum DSM 19573]
MKKVMKKIMEWIIFELLFAGLAILFSLFMAFQATVARNHNLQDISLFNIDYSKVMIFTRILSFLTVPVMTIIATVFKIVIDAEGDERNHEKKQS